jgi:hypothetical protein
MRPTVPRTDDELLAFDKGDLEDWGEQRMRAALDGRYGALYRNHLRIALHLDTWAEAEVRRTDVDAHYRAGYTQALHGMAASCSPRSASPGQRHGSSA